MYALSYLILIIYLFIVLFIYFQSFVDTRGQVVLGRDKILEDVSWEFDSWQH